MDKEPRILLWNYLDGEKDKLDALLKEIGAPHAVAIENHQGYLTMRDILHTEKRAEKPFTSPEKVLLFYNIPQKGILFLLQVFKQADLPRPIYAVITEHSINWTFSELLEHLVEERDEMERRKASLGNDSQ